MQVGGAIVPGIQTRTRYRKGNLFGTDLERTRPADVLTHALPEFDCNKGVPEKQTCVQMALLSMA